MKKEYYYILMSQKDFFENEVIEELLRERANYYLAKNKIKDFWIINSPNFITKEVLKNKIQSSNFYEEKYNKINIKLGNLDYQFYTTLVTSDLSFIKWIQLRLGYFENINDILENNNKTRKFKSDGLFGQIDNIDLKKSLNNFIHPDILLSRYKKSLQIYYNLNN